MLKRILVLAALLAPTASMARDPVETQGQNRTSLILKQILIFEGVTMVNAWMASENPEVYGGVMLLLSPLVADTGSTSNETAWVSLAAAGALALYNLNIDPEEKSKQEIFEENILAWHLFAGAVGLSNYLFDDSGRRQSLSFAPTPDNGFRLRYRYRFH